MAPILHNLTYEQVDYLTRDTKFTTQDLTDLRLIFDMIRKKENDKMNAKAKRRKSDVKSTHEFKMNIKTMRSGVGTKNKSLLRAFNFLVDLLPPY